MFTFLLVMVLGLGSGVAGYKLARVRDQSYPALPETGDGDEEILAYLEASAVTSPLANKLLNDCRDVKLLPAHPPQDKPDWYHSDSDGTPCEELWKLAVADITLEEKDVNKLKAVAHWHWAQRFTNYEKVELLKLFSDEYMRNLARDILFMPRNQEAVNKAMAAKGGSVTLTAAAGPNEPQKPLDPKGTSSPGPG
jgi:hypothetical protein